MLAEDLLEPRDVVLADAPVPAGTKVKAYSHALGESDVTWFGSPKLATAYRRRFPKSLDGAPVLVPTDNSTLRRALDRWFDEIGVRPVVVAEFADSALMKAFGQTGVGLFCAPTVVAREIQRQYSVKAIGRVESVKERFYAISVERRLKNPAVVAITEQAREEVFAKKGRGRR